MARKSKQEYMNQELPTWLNGLLIFGAAAGVIAAELKRPLRRRTQDKLRRNARNMAMSFMTAGTIAITEKPAAMALMRLGRKKGWGLLNMVRLPPALEVFVSVLLLDYTLYVWHYLTHKVPLLWRFHQVHHADLDLDASTALRFHALEMLFSVPWRSAQIFVFGISPLGLAVWQTMTLMEILFHHSNTKLPSGFERRLCYLIVTPRMHGIHHSIVQEETDSNWATIFSWPDFLHRTIRLNVPQKEITIGVPAFLNPKELTLGKLMTMPFTADRPSWNFRDNGKPVRSKPLPLPKTTLES